MSSHLRQDQVVLGNVRVAFPAVYEPVFKYEHATDADTEKEFKAELWISEEQLDELKKKAVSVVMDKLELSKEKAIAWIKGLKPDYVAFRKVVDPETKEERYICRAKRPYAYTSSKTGDVDYKKRPDTFDRRKNPTEATDPQAIVSGCYADAVIALYAYKGKFSGIGCDLCALRYREAGDPIGRGDSRVDPDAFEDLEDPEVGGEPIDANDNEPWD